MPDIVYRPILHDVHIEVDLDRPSPQDHPELIRALDLFAKYIIEHCGQHTITPDQQVRLAVHCEKQTGKHGFAPYDYVFSITRAPLSTYHWTRDLTQVHLPTRMVRKIQNAVLEGFDDTSFAHHPGAAIGIYLSGTIGSLSQHEILQLMVLE
jgi:hypothetical protein